MNKSSKPAIKALAVANSLGTIQIGMEKAAEHLRKKQAALDKATFEASEAEEHYSKIQVEFTKAVADIQALTKVARRGTF